MESDEARFDGWDTETALDARLPTTVEQSLPYLIRKAGFLIQSSRRPIAPDRVMYLAHSGGDKQCGMNLREYAGMLDGCAELLTPDDLRSTCMLFVDAQREDGGFPQSIMIDGSPRFVAHRHDRYANPVADSAAFISGMLWHTSQFVDDSDFLHDALHKVVDALQAVPRNPRTELVPVAPGPDNTHSPEPLTEAAAQPKGGLFPSLLHVQACNQIADLLQALGKDGEADMWRATAQTVGKRIRMYFWDKEIGLFRATTEGSSPHDLWGSAFAVYSNVATSGQLMAIGRYLQGNHDTIVRRGRVCRIPPNDVSDETLCSRHTARESGYSATPVGWMIYALDLVDSELADRTAADLCADFALNGVHEWIDGTTASPADHTASAAFPIAGLKRTLARREKRAGQGIGAL